MVLTPNSTATPPIYLFSTPEGSSLCRRLIFAKLKYDPHDYQLEGVCKALDRIDVLAVTPTGSGKTGFLTMYLLVMHAVTDDPSLCAPKKPPPHFRKDGAMVVVCPMKSLEVDMEPKFSQAGLRALVINKDTADKERRMKNADIWDRAPDQDVLLLAPEQLSSKGFERLLLNKSFQHRVVALGVDEAHLLVTWGKSFRKDFEAIGPARVRFEFPPILIVLTATLRIGTHYRGVCLFLGLHAGHFHFIRRSNVRYDIRFLFRTVRSSAQAIMFPELDWVLTEKRRVIVFCQTISLSFRVALYLLERAKLLDGMDYGTRDEWIRMYTALNWDSYNEQTLTMVYSGAASWTLVATDTLSVGVDLSGTQDVVLYDFGLPVDSDTILQKAGRIRDGKGKDSRVVVYLPHNAMEVCQHALSKSEESASEDFTSSGAPGSISQTIDISTARLVVALCKVKEINALYSNPDEDLPCKCQSCSIRPPVLRPEVCNCSGCIPEDSLETALLNPALKSANPVPPRAPKKVPTDQRITKKMRATAQLRFHKFRQTLRENSDSSLADFLPAEEFLPEDVIKALLDNFYDIVDVKTLETVASNYIHLQDYWPSLLQLLGNMSKDFEDMRAKAKAEAAEKSRVTRARNKAQKEAADAAAAALSGGVLELESSEDSDSEDSDKLESSGSSSDALDGRMEQSMEDIVSTSTSQDVLPKITIPGGQSVRFHSHGNVHSLAESEPSGSSSGTRLTIKIPSRYDT